MKLQPGFTLDGREQEVEGQTLNRNGGKMQRSERYKQRENKQKERKSWGEKGGKERQRMSNGEMGKKIRPPILKIREGWL